MSLCLQDPVYSVQRNGKYELICGIFHFTDFLATIRLEPRDKDKSTYRIIDYLSFFLAHYV